MRKGIVIICVVLFLGCDVLENKQKKEPNHKVEKSKEIATSVNYELSGEENINISDAETTDEKQEVFFNYTQSQEIINSSIKISLKNGGIYVNDTSSVFSSIGFEMRNENLQTKEYQVKVLSEQTPIDSTYDGFFISTLEHSYDRQNADLNNSWEQVRKTFYSSVGTVNIISIDKGFIEGDFDIKFNLERGQQTLWSRLGSSADTTIILSPKLDALTAKGAFRVEY